MVKVASASRSISVSPLVDQRNDLPAARLHLFDVRHDLRVHRVPRGDEDHRHVLVDERDRPVLHLRRGIALGVDVGDLLELERALERHREVDAASQVERVGGRAEEPLGQRLDLGGAPEDLGDLLRQAAQRLDELPALQDAQVPEPRQPKRHQRERRHLAGERLGARDADLRAGVQVDAAVHLAGDRGAHHVHQAHRPCPAALGLADRRQRVGGLAALGDADDQRAAVHHRIAVAELGGVLDLHRESGPSPRACTRR